MNGVLKASPKTVVLVGAAAFRELTRSDVGPQLLMRVYQNAFLEAARVTGYGIRKMVDSIMETFKLRAREMGKDYLDTLVQNAIEGTAEQQDSRLYKPPRRGSKE